LNPYFLSAMALEFSPQSQQNTMCGMKRKADSTPSSMFTKLDWLDSVVADVTASKISSHESSVDKKVKVEPCLQEFFINMLQSRGYPASTHATLACGYSNQPTQHQMLSYGLAFTDAIRTSNLQRARSFLFEKGLNPNACNKFGESVVHVVCRRGNHTMLQLLLDAGCSVQVCDDFGRTPLHDACWTSEPNFELISMLLDQDPWLLSLKDRRGTTPLGYVKYDSHCRLWREYLSKVADNYWPAHDVRTDNTSHDELKRSSDSLPTIPPLALLEPNSRPIPDPKISPSLETLERVANGLQEEVSDQSQNAVSANVLKRITSISTGANSLFRAPNRSIVKKITY
jgi:hypothetical protein